MKKRFLSLALVLVMALSLLPTVAFAADSDFTIENGVLTGYNGSNGDVVIPDGVTSIGAYTFAFTGLTSVTIPNSVTSIGDSAFAYTGLTSVTIPDSVTNIGDGAFSGCSSLTSVTIPNSVTRIGASAFDYTGLTSVTIPDSVTSIGEWAFGGCTNLASVTIPDSVTSIGESAFWACYALTSVTIPNSVTSIGKLAFADCFGLSSITIPASVTQIGEYAFSNGPMTISYGGSEAQWKNTGVITDSYQTIQYNCEVSSSTDFTIENGVLTKYNGSGGDVVIPDGVTSIGQLAFEECKSLTSITIPNSVTSIGGGAFAYCESLTSITIPNSVTSIGQVAFAYCESLTSVTIPDSVTSIEKGTFGGCTSLTSITIPSSVTNIGEIAFADSGLTDIYYGGSEAEWQRITISLKNSKLISVTIHFNSANSSTTQTPVTLTAYASTQNVLVDGKSVEFQCYALKDANGYDTNYIKLRDVASILNGTAAQFNVGWDGNVNVETGKAYVSNGSEMSTPFSGNRAYENATATTNVNGKAADLNAIVLKDDAGNGYTYYKLRDLGNALGFTVDWSAEKGIFIETN